MRFAIAAELGAIRAEENGSGEKLARLADDGGQRDDAAVALRDSRGGGDVGGREVGRARGVRRLRRPGADQRIFRERQNLGAELGGMIEHREHVVGVHALRHVHLHGRHLAGRLRRHDRLVGGPATGVS